MARAAIHIHAKVRDVGLNVQLVGFDRESADQIQRRLRCRHFRMRRHPKMNPDMIGQLKDSLWVVEMKEPTLLKQSIEKARHVYRLRGWRRQFKGCSPILVTPWLNPSSVKDHIVARLLEENVGATIFWGQTYKHELVNFLLDYCQKDPSRILTNVTVTDSGVSVTFGDGKQADVALTEFRRLAESNEISWDNIRIAGSRDYLHVGLLTGQDIPVPSDVLREFVKEEQNRRRVENQKLRKETSSILGRQTRLYREGKQMTQEELADRAKVSRWTIIRLESGKILPRVSALERIAQALGLSLASLLSSEA